MTRTHYSECSRESYSTIYVVRVCSLCFTTLCGHTHTHWNGWLVGCCTDLDGFKGPAVTGSSWPGHPTGFSVNTKPRLMERTMFTLIHNCTPNKYTYSQYA